MSTKGIFVKRNGIYAYCTDDRARASLLALDTVESDVYLVLALKASTKCKFEQPSQALI